MSTDATKPPVPPPGLEKSSHFISLRAALRRCVWCFIAGLLLNGFFVGIHSPSSSIRMFSDFSFAGKPTARGLLQKEDGQHDPAAGMSPEEKRRFIKVEFARYLQGMTWSWTCELQAATP